MSAAAATSSAPLGVDDIIDGLLASLTPTATTEDAENFRSNTERKTTPEVPQAVHTAVPPLPPVVATQHRVQFTIRGRRYETMMDVAVTYCLTFFAFFRCPLRGGAKSVGEVAAAAAAAESTAAALHDELSSEALLRHYTETVEPVLRAFLRGSCTAAATGSDGVGVTSARTAASCETGTATPAFTPPPLPRPRAIAYDAAAHLWKFEFPPRLSEEAEAAERLRRQQLAAASEAGVSATPGSVAKHITSDEINASPFLLLQNDYMGLLLVYLRRCAKVRAEARSAAPAPAGSAVYPTLPIRWAEMSYDEQVSFLQLLRTFGVVPLAAQYAAPSASIRTSQFVGAEAAQVAAAAKAEGDACSLRVKAEAFMRQQLREQEQEKERQQQQHQHQVKVAADKGEAHKTSKPAVQYDFEDLVLPAKGCARCGMSGHSTEECPY